MSFLDSIKTCFSKYVDFKGRASRAEYWWFFLSEIVLYLVFVILKVPALAILVALAYFLPLLAAAVRRLHDTGRSGWWYFIALVPLVGTIILIVFLASEGNPGANQYGSAAGATSAMGGGAVPPPPPPV